MAGNELRVGPLKFRVDIIAERWPSKPRRFAATPAPSAAAPPVMNSGKPHKQPPVKDVADVVQRTISKSDSMTEDDVSRWLLGVTDVDGPETLKETRSLRAEETRTTINRSTMTGDTATVEDVALLAQAAADGGGGGGAKPQRPVTKQPPGRKMAAAFGSGSNAAKPVPPRSSPASFLRVPINRLER